MLLNYRICHINQTIFSCFHVNIYYFAVFARLMKCKDILKNNYFSILIFLFALPYNTHIYIIYTYLYIFLIYDQIWFSVENLKAFFLAKAKINKFNVH